MKNKNFPDISFVQKFILEKIKVSGSGAIPKKSGIFWSKVKHSKKINISFHAISENIS